jgi:hypothetical protein
VNAPARASRRPNRRQVLGHLASGLLGLVTGKRLAATEWPAEWRQGSLVFHADFPLSRHAPILDELPTMQQSVPAALLLPAASEPIHIYLFREKRTYQRYLRQYFPGVPARRAMFIKQRGAAMVFAYYSNDFAVDLRHEATHAILHSGLPFVPLWVDEGLAEYFEVATAARYQGHPHLPQVRRQLAWRRFRDLPSLEQVTELSEMTNDDYRDAWAWVHFLLHGPAFARREFTRYFADIQAHTAPGALSERLRTDTRQLRPLFVQHFANVAPDQTGRGVS